MFIYNRARVINVEVPSVTFDQPLWKKAFEIVVAKNLKTVVCLEGFHTSLSFLGSIRTLMEGSGTEKLMEVIHVQNSVSHILSGKAIARALRAHFIIDSALTTTLLEELGDGINQLHLQELYQSVTSNQIIVEEVKIVIFHCN